MFLFSLYDDKFTNAAEEKYLTTNSLKNNVDNNDGRIDGAAKCKFVRCTRNFGKVIQKM